MDLPGLKLTWLGLRLKEKQAQVQVWDIERAGAAVFARVRVQEVEDAARA